MNILTIENLTKEYKNIKAVDTINFSVKEGEILGLLGPNGAGKSTTISIISTLFQPTSGTVCYKGTNIGISPKDIQKELGIVPQDIALYQNMNGYENMFFWGHAYGLRGQHLKKRISEVSEIIGISNRLKDKVKTYSGGMKRRLNIGVALLHEPKLLIMDEPTVGIDPQSRNHILETVKKLNENGMTIIYTSHYMEEVEYLCNRIQIMDSGKIIASGTKDELITIVEGKKQTRISFDNITPTLINTISNIPYISNLDATDQTIYFETENGENLIEDILEKSRALDVKIMGLDIQSPNLESVFLHLTGKALRD